MPSMVRMRLPSKKSAPVMQVCTSSLVLSSLVPDHHAGMADADAAAQPRAGEPQHLVQHVDHHHAFGHVDQARGACR